VRKVTRKVHVLRRSHTHYLLS